MAEVVKVGRDGRDCLHPLHRRLDGLCPVEVMVEVIWIGRDCLRALHRPFDGLRRVELAV